MRERTTLFFFFSSRRRHTRLQGDWSQTCALPISQVRTHYPKRLEDEIAIMEAELTRFPADGFQTVTPAYMKEIVAELTQLARKAPEISQRSGVSVRVSICNYENLVSSALKRAIRLGEQAAAPRVSDLGAVLGSPGGQRGVGGRVHLGGAPPLAQAQQGRPGGPRPVPGLGRQRALGTRLNRIRPRPVRPDANSMRSRFTPHAADVGYDRSA